MEDSQRRTYSTWWFLGAFALLAGLGLAALLLVGTPSSSTEIVPTPQTLLDGQTPSNVTGEGEPGNQPEAPAAVPPESGDEPAAAPAGDPAVANGTPGRGDVEEVLSDGDVTVLRFAFPGDLDPATFESAVAPVSASPEPGGASLVVQIWCAMSADELLTLLAVDEAGPVMTVTPLVLVPPGGAPCDPSAEPIYLEVPLRAARTASG